MLGHRHGSGPTGFVSFARWCFAGHETALDAVIVPQYFNDTPPVCDGRREDQHCPAIGRQFNDLATRGGHEGVVVDQRLDFFTDEFAGAEMKATKIGSIHAGLGNERDSGIRRESIP